MLTERKKNIILKLLDTYDFYLKKDRYDIILVIDKNGVERFRYDINEKAAFYDGTEFESYMDMFNIDRGELRKLLKEYLVNKFELKISLLY